MNDLVHSIPNSWYLIGSALLVLMAIFKAMFGNPYRHIQHTIYLSGTLGAGKTSYAAMVARHYRKKGYKVYSTFALEGAIPFDMSIDSWPKGSKVVVILDEMLRLKKQKFYDVGTLADGLTMARQWGQIVIVLSQSHLSDLGDLEGTFQVFAITKKALPLGPFGNINFMRFSSNKFRRFSKLKAEGSLFSAVYIPPSIWKDYDSKKIFGLTCHKDLTDIPEDQIAELRIRREARFRLRRKMADQLARDEAARMLASGEYSGLTAAAPRAAQPVPATTGAGRAEGRPVGQRSKNPQWFRPGGRSS